MMVLLCIMDGFGLREATADNAIAAAHKPVYDNLLATCPHTAIDGSGPAVGLPKGQMGNSEVGHLNLGAGRVVYQDISRIDRSIEGGEFFANKTLVAAMDRLAREKKALHLFGLLSDGKVHSSLDHLYALVTMAKEKGVTEVYLHAFLDGRDTLPTDGERYMRETLSKFDEIGLGKVATVGGRYYGMDRDRRWDRTELAYQAIVNGKGEKSTDPVAAIKASYAKDITDEFMIPVVIDSGNPKAGCLNDGDVAMMFNFRADRMRQLAWLFAGVELEDNPHSGGPKIELVTMTDYDETLKAARVCFSRKKLTGILGEKLAGQGLKQLRTAETEKYAHVTFFFNGGVEEPFDGEDRDMIPSPKVATYDLMPEMSSVAVTDNVVEKINSGKYDFVLLNYANCDMVGHSGIFEAAKKAVEAVDVGLGRVLEAVRNQNGVALVTADHGNAETMIDPRGGGPWTAHTTNLVPLILYDPGNLVKAEDGTAPRLRDNGILADIAPTILDILGLDIPSEMTGKSLLLRG